MVFITSFFSLHKEHPKFFFLLNKGERKRGRHGESRLVLELAGVLADGADGAAEGSEKLANDALVNAVLLLDLGPGVEDSAVGEAKGEENPHPVDLTTLSLAHVGTNLNQRRREKKKGKGRSVKNSSFLEKRRSLIGFLGIR